MGLIQFDIEDFNNQIEKLMNDPIMFKYMHMIEVRNRLEIAKRIVNEYVITKIVRIPD